MQKMTPAMRQFYEAKTQHPDALILFRMGDFYESFGEDAGTIARELEITLTTRGKGCLLYTSPSPRDVEESRMPSSA